MLVQWREVGHNFKIIMQNTLPLTPGNPLRNVTGLARQIALPGEFAPMRFPSFPALERTAVISFNQPTTMDVPASSERALTLFRQSAYPLWADKSQNYSTVVNYGLEHGYPNAALAATTGIGFKTQNAIISWQAANVAPTTGSIGVTGIGSPITYPILGRDANCPGPEFTFVPGGTNLLTVVSASAVFGATWRFTVSFEIWDGPGQTRWYDQTGTSGDNVGVTGGSIGPNGFTDGVWIRPVIVELLASVVGQYPEVIGVALVVTSGLSTYTPSAVNRGNVAFAEAAAVMHLPVSAPTEFATSQIPWFSSRLTACAFLGTNVTQVLNKGGTVLGGRLNPAQYNAWTTKSSVVTNLHPAEKAYLPLESGVYTYCPPSTDLANFYDYTLNTGNGAAAAPIFNLANDALYNRVYITAPPAACSLALTLSWHLEFRTTSALFQVGMSAMTLEALHSAQLVLAETGFFFENPEHDHLLERVIGAAKKYVPQVVGVANPAAGKLLQSLAARMTAGTTTVKPKNGPSKPPTTTAAASGMMPKGKPKKDAGSKKKNGKKK